MKVKAICSPNVNMVIVLLIVSMSLPKIGYNICVCDVAGFRSRRFSRETKRWFYKNTKI